MVAKGDSRVDFKMDYFPPPPPVSEIGTLRIRPPSEVLLLGNSLWNSYLVGSFLNSRLTFKMVEDTVHKLWDKFGLQRVFLQDKGFFVFKFSSPQERDNVLALGPWYISNKLLCLEQWKEGMDFKFETCTKAPIWVKFHNVPLSYLSPTGLS